ncbi:MAG: phosphatidylserine decarboxylase [Spirochaetia bacterium]|nr:phosphatidylserine decarboxylase [Spirochaetia bacterium]
MTLFQLRDDLVLPFVGLLLAGGLFLTIKLGFFQIRHLLLSIKILTGALDWKGAKGKIVPFQAFTAGSGSTIVVGAVLGTVMAYAMAGPGILPFIWFSFIPAAAIQFCSASFSVRFRRKLPGGRLLCGVSVYTEAGLKANWLALVHAGLFFVVSLAMGAALPNVVLHHVASAGGLQVSAFTLSITLGIALAFLMIGGIRRIGWASGYLVVLGVIAAAVGTFFLISDLKAKASDLPSSGFFATVFQGAADLLTPKPGVRLAGFFPLLGGLAAFLALTETGSGKSAAIAGTVRTDFPAKQGLAAVGAPLFQSFVVSTLTIYVLHLAAAASVPDISVFAFGLSRGAAYLLGAVLLLSVAGLAGWIFSGYQTALYAGGRQLGIAFEIVFLAALFAAGYAVRTSPDVGPVILAIGITWISSVRLPRFIRVPVLLAFAKFYKIDLDEAEMKLAEYPSLNRFFTRALKAGVRVIDEGRTTIVSPVDARVSQFGPVHGGRMIQAKGIDYTVADLLENSEHVSRFDRGHYMVMYLSPQDYHRIHSPFTGEVIGYSYSPGALFAVNNIAVNGLAGLFPKNERLTTYLRTPHGLIGVVKVGATNVGKIVVTYDTVKTNRWIRRADHHTYANPIPMEKGAELGRFEMGSTVILLFENNTVKIDSSIVEQTKVRFGQAVASFIKH